MAEVKYTEFAQQALGLAEIFNATFKPPLPGSPTNYRVQLAIPDGPSTSGGKQGTQHIKLVPLDGGATLVVGWVNQADGAAELRGWEHLKAITAERTRGAGLPDEAAFRKLLLDIKRFLERERLSVTVVAVRRQDGDEDDSALSVPLVAAVTLGALAVFGLVAFLLLR